MYPNLYFLFQDLFGWEIHALKLVNTFGLMVALAFVVLSDDSRREVYDSAGFEGLVKSESYSELSVFELDAIGFLTILLY